MSHPSTTQSAWSVSITRNGETHTFDPKTPEGFGHLSDLWVDAGWDLKYTYQFSWAGLPICQLPEDLVRIQEVLHSYQPDFMIETGISRGGSQAFYASLCHQWTLVKDTPSRVIGIDHRMWPATQKALEAHPLKPYMIHLHGDAVAPEVLAQVREHLQEFHNQWNRPPRVFIMLDDDHSKAHVLEELALYTPFLQPEDVLVVSDGIMKRVAHGERGNPQWEWDNADDAITDFLAGHPQFQRFTPAPPFTRSPITHAVTQWPNGWLKRKPLVQKSLGAPLKALYPRNPCKDLKNPPRPITENSNPAETYPRPSQ